MANILIAEDDESVRAFVRRALELDGHRVAECTDGADALAVLAELPERHDLLISDICMPNLDGIGLARQVASRFPALRVMLMTGFADQREGAADLGRHVRDIVMKPFTLAQIRERVQAVLAQ